MRKWLPLVTVCLGTFMLLIDVTIVNVALPDMARDLRTSFGSLQWVVDAYALALAALVLGTGSIADLVGHRRAYIAGLALFAAASLACGLAPNSAALVTARAVQGVGAAAMFATTFALLNSNYTGRDRGTAYGMWGAVAGASAAVGPILGGLLTEGASWRWIFFVNLPASVIAIVLCRLALRDAVTPYRARVDVAGMAAFTGAAGTLTYGLIRANEHGWGAAGTWTWLAAAPLLAFVFVLVEIGKPQPMLDLALLRNGRFVGILLGGMIMTFAAFSSFTYTSIWLQSVLAMSPIQAGLTGLPLSLSSFVVSAMVGRFLVRANSGRLISAALLIVGLGGVVSAVFVHGSARWPALIPGFLLIGVGVGMAMPSLSSAAMEAVPLQRGGMAAGALNTFRQLGFALGIAALGSVFAARATGVLADRGVSGAGGVAQALAGGQAPVLLRAAPATVRPALDADLHAAAVAGVQWSFAVSGIAGVLAALAVYALLRRPASVAPQQPVPVASAIEEPDPAIAG
jgi:EmrB/QacA subfamily drug resistance transporter